MLPTEMDDRTIERDMLRAFSGKVDVEPLSDELRELLRRELKLN
jgi:hypothetical protein